ncbi:hypothetical protein [Parvicella tangerina]|uniref:GIY-YIG nuclease family protein n=1 Tax=Parvicella tangerina TaxID=2829795 RepID=A0A916JQA3_9FLAO|nr:hypothetical protein [Parvicella tangerina]CAG5086835.1 hypothetical protein CRYO30217_03299 [Parvicella tangerina]
MILELSDTWLKFEKASLKFNTKNIESAFKTKNNKTLGETLEHPKYFKLKEKITSPIDSYLDMPLGDFLLKNKSEGNEDYKLFLNRHGDNIFCDFQLQSHLESKGIYAWVVGSDIKYIGRCTDNFKKRVNYGYGRINAKNCFIDGQSTNCHLNSEINKLENIDFYVHEMNNSSTEQINELELKILNELNFDWNIKNN